jgi:hypothetical protein
MRRTRVSGAGTLRAGAPVSRGRHTALSGSRTWRPGHRAGLAPASAGGGMGFAMGVECSHPALEET